MSLPTFNRQAQLAKRLHRWTIVSTRTLFAHALVALLLSAAIYFLPNKPALSSQDALLNIFTSLIPATGALLGIAAALATFFSRFAADAREKGLDRLDQSRDRLERQMRESADVDGEISNRLVSLYQMAAGYVPGQVFKAEEVDRAHREFFDWAKQQANKSGQQGTKFSYGDSATYGLREKHLVDASLRSLQVRRDLVFLESAAMMARAVPSLKFLVYGWFLTFLSVVGLTLFVIRGLVPTGWALPMLAGSSYLVFASHLTLVFSARSIILLTVMQDIGYDMAQSTRS